MLFYYTKQENLLIKSHIESGNEYKLIGCNCCDKTKICLILKRYDVTCKGCFCCNS
jgi:hypothetical protein